MSNKLLLADDSITIQKVVAIIFANEEFELSVVDNGDAALAKAREIQPDVMLVDALMPGKTGYEVCSEIRRDPKLSAVPILLLIGAFEPLDEEKVRSCGADATISKPFESQQLIDKVKELLALGKTRVAAPAPAAAPAPPALEAAEDIWSDLSSIDTMAPPAAARPAQPAAPVHEPAAPIAFAAPQSPQQGAPAAPAFAAPQTPAAPQQAEAEEEILEATIEDDLWGAFDLEEIPAEAPVSSGFGVVESGGEFEAEEFFTFEDDEGVVDSGPVLDLVEEPVVQPSAEELFSFEEEPQAGVVAEPQPLQPEPAPFELPEYEPFSLEEENLEPAAFAQAPAAEPAAPAGPAAWELPATEAQAAPGIGAAPAAAAAPTAAAPAAAAAPAGSEGRGEALLTGLTEADLKAALSKISREVIERIVWEVVPDLAEVLIKEEIRKLREGARG
jgi:CheY-like chemotaxis protein